MKTIEHHGAHLVLLRDVEAIDGAKPQRLLARERVGLFSAPPSGATPFDVTAFLGQARQLAAEIKGQLVCMDEEIDLVLTALLSGDTIFFLSLPGAAKTTLARLIAKGVGGDFFRRNLTPDTSRNDLFGPLDPEMVKQGLWGRKLSGVATASIVNIDEVFKGSGPVQDMLLEALEEHTLSEPDCIHPLPLLLGISASNELVNATIQNAFWDRLIIRKEVNYPVRDEDWEAILASAHGTLPIQTRLDPQEVMLVQGLVEIMAGELTSEVRKRMVRIKRQLEKNGVAVSPRRFLAWARVATARAMLLGEDRATPKSLTVGEHILWIGQEEIPVVRDVVRSLSDPQRGFLRAAEADIEKILANLHSPATTLSELVQWQKAVTKHEALLKSKVIDPEHASERDELLARIRQASAEMISHSAEVMQQKVAQDAR